MAAPHTALPLDGDTSDSYHSPQDLDFATRLAAIRERAHWFRERYDSAQPNSGQHNSGQHNSGQHNSGQHNSGQQGSAHWDPDTLAQAIQDFDRIQHDSHRLYSYPVAQLADNPEDPDAQYYRDQVQALISDLSEQLAFFRRRLEGEVETLDLLHSPTPNRTLACLRDWHWQMQTFPRVITDDTLLENYADLTLALCHSSPDVRLSAYQSVRQVLEAHNPFYGYILKHLIQDHHQAALQQGYDWTVGHQLNSCGLSVDVLDTVTESLRERVELFQQFYRLKGKATGRVVRICDLYAPWEPDPDAVDLDVPSIIRQAFKEFHPDYAQSVRSHLKQTDPSTFKSDQDPVSRESFNYPLGLSGLHDYQLLAFRQDPYPLFAVVRELTDQIAPLSSPQPAGDSTIWPEVRVLFNELLVLDTVLKLNIDTSVQATLLAHHLERQIGGLFHQNLVTHFELVVHQVVTPESDPILINEEWLKSSQELCGDAVELLPDHQFDWGEVRDVFHQPFNSYRYTLVTVIALACYRACKEGGREASSRHLELLESSVQDHEIERILKEMGIDLQDPLQVHQALDCTENWVELLEEMMDD